MSDECRCEECPKHRWSIRQHGPVLQERRWWEAEAKRQAYVVAGLRLDIEHMRQKDLTNVAWLQAKVVAQARELKRVGDAEAARQLRASGAVPEEPS